MFVKIMTGWFSIEKDPKVLDSAILQYLHALSEKCNWFHSRWNAIEFSNPTNHRKRLISYNALLEIDRSVAGDLFSRDCHREVLRQLYALSLMEPARPRPGADTCYWRYREYYTSRPAWWHHLSGRQLRDWQRCNGRFYQKEEKIPWGKRRRDHRRIVADINIRFYGFPQGILTKTGFYIGRKAVIEIKMEKASSLILMIRMLKRRSRSLKEYRTSVQFSFVRSIVKICPLRKPDRF